MKSFLQRDRARNFSACQTMSRSCPRAETSIEILTTYCSPQKTSIRQEPNKARAALSSGANRRPEPTFKENTHARRHQHISCQAGTQGVDFEKRSQARRDSAAYERSQKGRRALQTIPKGQKERRR